MKLNYFNKLSIFLLICKISGFLSATLKTTLDTDESQCITTSQKTPVLQLHCAYPWVLVGKRCLFADLTEKGTWQEGRNFCNKRNEGSDLATFEDANDFSEVLSHLRTISSDEKNHFWIGGSDVNKTNDWFWITGEAMPMGSPFWGDLGERRYEPDPSDSEHCAFLYSRQRYYMHDLDCNITAILDIPISPLCQYVAH